MMVDHSVGAADSLLTDGGMIRLELEGKPIVLARIGADYFAFGGNCSHYGAPLDKGMLKGHTIMCPWHHACFDIRSGTRTEPPALNDLPCYPVRIADDQVVISLPHTNEREPQGKLDRSDGRVFVIVGGGAAGNAAAEELRRAGFRGRIMVISASATVPVDRPNLSKDYLAGEAEADWIPLRGQDWYAERDIELRLSTQVEAILPEAHLLRLADSETVTYDKLLICTGGIPRYFHALPGAVLRKIYTLRSLQDADRIVAATPGAQRAVVIGASFIGLEVAAALAHGRQVEITVVAPDAVPFERVLGGEIGQMLQREHEANQVNFRLGSTVRALHGNGDQVTGVELDTGEVLPADFVVVGIGVRPATDFLKGSAVDLDSQDASVLVDTHLQTTALDIFAAGDIARWSFNGDRGQRIEHWRAAQQQGIVAARNMLGGLLEITERVPFFWTSQWDITLRYVGHASQWDEIIYRDGRPKDKSFIAFYLHKGVLKAAVGCQHDRDMDAIEFILRDQLPLRADQMRDSAFDLIAYASGVKSAAGAFEEKEIHDV
jgi:apoptosis-inducing factor 3